MSKEAREKTVERLHELSLLAKGWLNGEGEVIDRRSISLAGLATLLMIDRGWLAMPRLFPTYDGHVQLELVDGDRAIDVRFAIDHIDVGITNTLTGENDDHTIVAAPLDDKKFSDLMRVLALPSFGALS